MDTDQKESFYIKSVNYGRMDELKWIIKEVWCKDIDQNVCKNLTDFMPSRIQNVIKNKGYHTKY